VVYLLYPKQLKPNKERFVLLKCLSGVFAGLGDLDTGHSVDFMTQIYKGDLQWIHRIGY
jgi:hypothetical protein